MFEYSRLIIATLFPIRMNSLESGGGGGSDDRKEGETGEQDH